LQEELHNAEGEKVAGGAAPEGDKVAGEAAPEVIKLQDKLLQRR
jgi:hypothetical protein